VYGVSLLFDLALSPDPSVLFRGLLPLTVSDFGYAISINSVELLGAQLASFGRFAREYHLPDRTPFLHYAALVCHNPTLFRQICEKCDLTTVDVSHRRTAVFYALRNRNISILQTLIDCGVDIDACDSNRKSPLIYCLENGYTNRARFLLDNGASVHKTLSDTHVSALSWAIEKRSSDWLKLLLPYAGNEINCPDANGLFPIHLCLKQGFSEGIVLIDQLCPLLNANMFAEAVGHPLHYLLGNHLSEQAGSPPLLACLISIKSLDLNFSNSAGFPPLLVALTDDAFAVVESVVEGIVDLLATDPRCDVNAPSRDGVTPLYVAVTKNQVQIVKTLLAYGAFPNQPNTDGKTPIFAAVEKGNAQLLTVLLGTGANQDQWYVNKKLPSQLDNLTPEIRAVLQQFPPKRVESTR
jgi:ankyrin repeat protein